MYSFINLEMRSWKGNLMSIKKGEWEKLFRNPVLIVLTGIFLIYNFILINDNSYIKGGLYETNKLISQVGYKVDEDMFKKLENMYDEKMKDLNELTERKLQKTFESMDEFLANKEISNFPHVSMRSKYFLMVASMMRRSSSSVTTPFFSKIKKN